MQKGQVRLLVVLVVLTLGIVAIWPMLWAAFVHAQGERFAAPLIGDLKQAIGLNPWQEKFLLVGMGAVGALAVYLALSFSSARRAAGFLLVFAMNAATYGYLWRATSDHWFTSDGKPLKCYVLEAKRIRVRDVVAVDPETGRPCRPVNTPELRERLEGWLKAAGAKADLTLVPVSRPERFFSSFLQGEAIVWYFLRSDGVLEFFDLPGFHPVYGAELLPVTPAIVEALQRREAAAAQSAAASKADQNRRNLLSRYLAAPPSPGSVLLATSGLGELELAAREALASAGQVVVLSGNFVRDGLFESVWRGDRGSIERLALSSGRLMALVQPSVAERVVRSPDLDDLTVIEQDFAVLLFEPVSATNARLQNFTATGRGFSDQAARASMRSDFATKLRMLVTPR